MSQYLESLIGISEAAVEDSALHEKTMQKTVKEVLYSIGAAYNLLINGLAMSMDSTPSDNFSGSPTDEWIINIHHRNHQDAEHSGLSELEYVINACLMVLLFCSWILCLALGEIPILERED